MTIEVTYVGPHNAVEIEATPGTFTVVASGQTIEVSDKLAKGDPAANLGGLLDQPANWVEPKKPAPKTKQ